MPQPLSQKTVFAARRASVVSASTRDRSPVIKEAAKAPGWPAIRLDIARDAAILARNAKSDNPPEGAASASTGVRV